MSRKIFSRAAMHGRQFKIELAPDSAESFILYELLDSNWHDSIGYYESESAANAGLICELVKTLEMESAK